MDFEVNQPIEAPLWLVEQAFVDPTFYQALGQLAAIEPPKLLECRPDQEDDALVHLVVHYTFGAKLNAAARAVLDPEKLSWTDRSVLDRRAHEVRFEMVPDHYGDRFWCKGRYRFVEHGPSTTHQVMQGKLEINYPVVGALAERAIYLGLRENLSAEAAILGRWAAERGGQERDTG